MNYPGHKFALTLFASVICLWLIAMVVLMRASALPPEATGTMLVVFEPSVSSDAAFAAITRAGAKPIRETSFGFIWVVNGETAGLSGRLVSEGAKSTFRDLPISPEIAGCIVVADAKITQAFDF